MPIVGTSTYEGGEPAECICTDAINAPHRMPSSGGGGGAEGGARKCAHGHRRTRALESAVCQRKRLRRVEGQNARRFLRERLYVKITVKCAHDGRVARRCAARASTMRSIIKPLR